MPNAMWPRSRRIARDRGRGAFHRIVASSMGKKKGVSRRFLCGRKERRHQPEVVKNKVLKNRTHGYLEKDQQCRAVRVTKEKEGIGVR